MTQPDTSIGKVIDFAEYKRLRNAANNADLLASFEIFVKRQICNDPLKFLRDMAKLHDIIRDIIEANRLPLPKLMLSDESMPCPIGMDSIRIPIQDYERLRRLQAALDAAQETLYG